MSNSQYIPIFSACFIWSWHTNNGEIKQTYCSQKPCVSADVDDTLNYTYEVTYLLEIPVPLLSGNPSAIPIVMQGNERYLVLLPVK